jgi:hypothetical protein
MANKKNERIKVAILYGTKADFNETAFKYFVLQLNKAQTLVEFGFPAVDDYLFPEITSDTDSMFKAFKEIRKKEAEDATTKEEDQVYIEEGNPNYFVLIIDSQIRDDLFADWQGDTAIVTTHRWSRDYSPPSVFEYLLNSICGVLLLLNPGLGLDTHMVARGCVLDYAWDKTESKVDAGLGYICDDCRNRIIQVEGEHYFSEMKKMAGREWIGNIDAPESVAHNLKRFFKFDIDRDSGFNKNFLEKSKEYLPEIPKETIVA